ncbi:hypothetical protein SDC9_193940 [bioreactor metagenome]|uniref:Uncharacterized protein n=1 Tax=bioreactor metagenome TaxID=1076179 RepID=A0A645IDI6_9ZZZZ
MAVVHPVFCERLSRGALRLGDLVFVVGEDQVHAAAMDIEGFAQVFHAHGGALCYSDVPGNSSAAVPRIYSTCQRDAAELRLAG